MNQRMCDMIKFQKFYPAFILKKLLFTARNHNSTFTLACDKLLVPLIVCLS